MAMALEARAPPGRPTGSAARCRARKPTRSRAAPVHPLRLPGALYASYSADAAHGRIKSVVPRQESAGRAPVVTIDDVPKSSNPYYGPAFHDQPILADGKVRFVGEPVAAVLAADPHVAEEAVQLITADYEELPAVYDEVEALTSKVYVHDQLKPAGTFADLKHLKDAKNTNMALDYRLRRGDVDKAFASAAHVFEHEFKTQKVLHLPFEPHASIGDYKDIGCTIYTASQGPSFVRTEIARLLGWPENKVRIKVPFSAPATVKLYIKLRGAGGRAVHDRAAAGQAPHLRNCSTQSQAQFRIKRGVDKEKRIIARRRVFRGGAARHRTACHASPASAGPEIVASRCSCALPTAPASLPGAPQCNDAGPYGRALQLIGRDSAKISREVAASPDISRGRCGEKVMDRCRAGLSDRSQTPAW